MEYDEIQHISPMAFILSNSITNENGRSLEFRDHKFLIKPYNDLTEEQYIMKPSQIGWSVLGINKALWLAKYKKANVIYTLPSKSVVKDFVMPKVDPIIMQNPIYREWMGATDSVALKAIGDRFVYFRGSFEQTAAISISAHVLINDEVDRSNPKVLQTYRTRLDDAKRDRPDLGFVWQFSNPSIPGYGVDEGYQQSCKYHWFVKCPHCNYEYYMKWPDNIDIENEQYVCANCRKELTDSARRNGRWVNETESDISGYWLSQMMIPWHSAKKIIRDSRGDQQVFHNFTLGLPYVSADVSITRSTIVKCISPDRNDKKDVCIGVDNGVIKTVIIGNKKGIFRIYETDSWSDVEADIVKYNAICVIDANPYPVTPTKLAKKYTGRVFIHYFKEDTKNSGIIQWGEAKDYYLVRSDRTKIIDTVVDEFLNQNILFNMTLTELEQYIYDWTQLYRSIETNARGIQKPVWLTIEERRDHYAFATIYWRIALEKTMFTSDVIKNELPRTEKSVTIRKDGTVQGLDLDDVLRNINKKEGDWKTK